MVDILLLLPQKVSRHLQHDSMSSSLQSIHAPGSALMCWISSMEEMEFKGSAPNAK